MLRGKQRVPQESLQPLRCGTINGDTLVLAAADHDRGGVLQRSDNRWAHTLGNARNAHYISRAQLRRLGEGSA